MKKILIATLLTVTLPAVAADVYRWKDEKGVWHFSDTPRQGADRYDLKPAPAIGTEPVRMPAAETTPPAAAAEVTLEMLFPEPEGTVRSAEGRLDVVLAVAPNLPAGARIRVLLNGQEVATPARSTQIPLAGIDRGAHTLSAELVGANGRILASVGPRTFYMHRPSILHPGAGPKPQPKPTPKPGA